MGSSLHCPAMDSQPADTAQDDQIQTPVQDGADTSAPNETPSDPADARPESEAQAAQPDGDDSTHDSDPLLLAQQSAPDPKPTAAKPEPAPKASPPPTPKTKPEPSDTPAAEAEPDPVSDLPPEIWSDLPHKAKSVFLAQRKAIKAAREQGEEARKARESYNTVEKLRQDQGLEPAEFVNGAIVNGMVKRGDPRVIPLLEQTIGEIRKRAGIIVPVPQSQAPSFDPAEILSAIAAAEADFDFDKLAGIKAKLEGAAEPPKPVEPPPQARQPVSQPATGGDAEAAEFQAINDALSGLGVADPVGHVREILSAHPELVNEPPGARLKAVLAKHRAMEPTPQPPRRPATGQPLSGRGGPVRVAGQTTTIDPLKHAIRR